MTSYPVVIIGCGLSGIAVLKACLEVGLKAICFEKTDHFGGLWKYRDEDIEGVPSIPRFTVGNSSKEINSFSDFPPTTNSPNFMNHAEFLDYVGSYMRHFKLESFISYNHEVVKVNRSDDYDTTGHWIVSVKKNNGDISDVKAAGVMVAVGHHTYPEIPKFPGISEFRGKVIHAHSIKDLTGMERKRVLVIGTGNSGMDIANEFTHVTEKVYLCTRRGAWVLSRLGRKGLPLDYSFTRSFAFLYHVSPLLARKYLYALLNHHFDHATYNLQPKHDVFLHHFTLSDELPMHILCGRIIMKGPISHFTPDGVVFQDEENRVYNFDVVVLATGFRVHMPFLDGILQVKNNTADLYCRVFPPEMKHPTLAIIGLFDSTGTMLPVIELQSRWAALVFKGQLTLPPYEEMLKEIHNFQNNKTFCVESHSNTNLVNLFEYMNVLATNVGCNPNWLETLVKDPILFYKLAFGPPVPYHYRLRGPQAWDGARDAILTVMDRTMAPFQSRKSPSSSLHQNHLNSWLPCAILTGIIAFIVFMLLRI